ncbi:hypothetical protein HF325_003806 [Metschnikowia pulcherrima]|uniref:Vacuolar calcium ion transporter n=1 Tax=Metschnikowia pulcherrima TaxID=27326 RepID=A0A8H7LBB7_9ASCO|nr:hypothetical protein HF325_003806 [Metschnikowia pulcherrima]
MSDRLPLLGRKSRGSSSVLSLLLTGTKLTLKLSPVNYLLIFVPLGLLAGILDWGLNAIFWVNFFAIVPLASILAFATEELAEHTGQTIGGLLNATFGNAVELIVLIIALKNNQVRIVQALMLGLILSNLLLVLGCCFVAGGITRVQQTFNQTVAQTMSSLMALATAGLLVPAAFHAAMPKLKDGAVFPDPALDLDYKILSLSRGVAVILLVLYILYLVFQLKTHKALFEEQSSEDEAIITTSVPVGEDHAETEHLSVIGSLSVLVAATVLVSFLCRLLGGLYRRHCRAVRLVKDIHRV